MKRTFSLFIFIMVYVSNTSGQDLDFQLQQAVQDIYQADVPGAALMVVMNDTLVISKGFGIANLETGAPVTPETNFRMASVSKQFTAFCILLLAQNSQLKLDDPVAMYLPELPPFAQSVTIKHLLTHSSGLQDYEALIPSSRTTQVSDADVLSMLSHSDSLYFLPGSRFRYSNTGYCLLTQVIERVAKMPYPDFIRKNVFVPLGMNNTFIMQQKVSIPHRAFGYHLQHGKWQFADQSITSATMGDGCVYTSPEDFAKWILSLWNDQLMSPT